MRTLNETRLQEIRTDIGLGRDNAILGVLPEAPAPRFELIRKEIEKADKLTQERERYGIKGDEDSWNAGYEACASQRENRHAEREQRYAAIVAKMLNGTSGEIYETHSSLALVQRDEITPEITEQLDRTFFYCALLLQRAAKLMGKTYNPPMSLSEIQGD